MRGGGIRFRIFPVLALAAALCLIVRAGEFVSGLRAAGVAFAQQETNAVPPPLPNPAEMVKDDKAHETQTAPPPEAEKPPEGQADAASPPPDPAAEKAAGEKVEWKDSTEAEYEYSQVREDLYKELTARREELDKREKDLATREAVLAATERELDQKIREMTAVRNEIESLMKQQSDEEQQRVDSLVKIYEGMKAKDAARIFNTLDMDVLISVIARMSERKSAPILAEMTPERARSVTILLAQQNQLPDIPPQ